MARKSLTDRRFRQLHPISTPRWNLRKTLRKITLFRRISTPSTVFPAERPTPPGNRSKYWKQRAYGASAAARDHEITTRQSTFPQFGRSVRSPNRRKPFLHRNLRISSRASGAPPKLPLPLSGKGRADRPAAAGAGIGLPSGASRGSRGIIHNFRGKPCGKVVGKSSRSRPSREFSAFCTKTCAHSRKPFVFKHFASRPPGSGK